MKTHITAVIIGLALLAGCQTPTSHAGHQVLRHVVLFKFTADTTPQQVKEIEDAFRALPSKIPGITGFEWGTDVSTEKRSEGFTHCFVVTFRSSADRDAYLPHAAHQAFIALAKPHIEKVLVLDYWAK